ncbi:BglG family transcription antiterminator [Scopulibacillus cellulosilyticus]|uniref:BglG family transcription antiterminator n=1 Tax=Scopulibacillus cellulosilyticus TaxID=2665665 RepID=A0ABW2Q4S9_9BACL
MSLDQRSTAILSYLINAQTYVKTKELIEKYHISRRTVYYDIGKINDWLKDNDLQQIKHVRSAGFLIETETAREVSKKLGTLRTWHYEYSAKERKAWLAIYLMARDNPLYLENLMEKIRVSRNTTIEDLKNLKVELERFHLKLEFHRKSGYVINGDEEDKRKAIVHFIQHVFPNENWQTFLSKIPMIINADSNQFDFEKLKAIQQIIGEIEQKLNIQFTDEILYSLSFRLLLFCRRVSQGKKIKIDPIEKDVLRKIKQYEAAQKIGERLAALFEIDFPEDEIFYITRHLLSSRIQFSEGIESTRYSNDSEILTKVVAQMVTDFQKYACVFFKNRQEIEKSLLLHVKPAYYRIRYGLEFESDLTESIKEQYHDIFLLTKKVISHLEAVVGKEINENEIALIAMHFGGWMRKVGAKPAVRKKAILVCTNGVGTSRLLLHQLEGLFSTIDLIGSVSLREYKKNQYDVDFIISTIPLEEKNKPVFVVNPILTEAEMESLLKKVNVYFDRGSKRSSSIDVLMEIIQKHANVLDKEGLQQELKQYLYKPEKVVKEIEKPSLNSILQKKHIQLKNEVSDWKEAIQTASAPLLKEGLISEEYVQAMIHNIHKMGPYIVISPKVAIPHARPEDGVNKLSMSLLKLSNAVPFSEKREHDIQIVIVLAAIDGEAHLRALSQLTKMFSVPKNVNKVLLAKSSEEIFSLVNVYSMQERSCGNSEGILE